MRAILSFMLFGKLLATTVIVHDGRDVYELVDVDEAVTLDLLQTEITNRVEGEVSFVVLAEASTYRSAQQSEKVKREYWTEPTEQNIDDIYYILRTLANRPLLSLMTHKKSLERAGDRIDHIHPFNFLAIVFSEEELKVCLRVIRQRGWVWNDFFAGLKDSLAEEHAAMNMTDDMIHDFAKRLGVPPIAVATSVQRKSWLQMIDLLIALLPREGDGDRYNM